jgi:hypothetical protein
MPRRSAADISIVPMLPGKGRPEPPVELDRAEARAWRDVVDSLPDLWLDPAGQLVLRRVAAQIAVAGRLEDRLRRLSEMADDPEALEAEAKIAGMHRDALKAVVNGMAALRATPRSRMTVRAGQTRFDRGAGSLRPWEIVARNPGDGPAS